MGDFVHIDGLRYRIIDRQFVRYPMPESDAERKARGDGPAPYVEYTSRRIERADG